jgi:hypothetical protein
MNYDPEGTEFDPLVDDINRTVLKGPYGDVTLLGSLKAVSSVVHLTMYSEAAYDLLDRIEHLVKPIGYSETGTHKDARQYSSKTTKAIHGMLLVFKDGKKKLKDNIRKEFADVAKAHNQRNHQKPS